MLIVSIVTPCLNQAIFIREAVESVLAQNYLAVEHIIVDGGSTDGTLDELAKFKELKIISELDNGIYDAINKGISLAQGDIIGFLNADDMYVPGVFQEIVERFRKNPQLEALSGGAEIFETSSTGTVVRRKFVSPFYSSLTVRNICLGQPILNARFFRKKVIDVIGPFDSSYKIASDREILIKMALAKVENEYLPKCIYRYRAHAGSMTFDPYCKRGGDANLEYWEIAEKFLNSSIPLRERLWVQIWHGRISAEMFARALKRRDLGQAASVMRRGFKAGPWWPVIFGLRPLRRLKRSLHGILR